MPRVEDPRLLVVLVASPPVLEMSRLVRRVEGQAQVLDDAEAATGVIWRGASSVESAMRLAAALHAEAAPRDELRVGVVALAGVDPHARVDTSTQGFRLAHTLTALAPAGVTLLSAPRQLIPPAVRCTVYGSLHPELTGPPLSIVQVMEVAQATKRHRPLVVGRDAELAEIRRLLAKVVASGRGVVVHVQGDAGIGKSHLLAEVRRIAIEHGFTSHQTLNHAHATARSHSAVAMLVRSLLETNGASPEADEASVERAVDDGRIGEDQLPFVRDLLDLPLGLEERRLFEAMETVAREAGQASALQSLVDTAATRGPLWIEVEDMHWASPECSRVLCSLASRVLDTRLVLLMTSRPAGDPVDDAWHRQASSPPLVRWRLDRLDHTDAQALAAAILSRRRAPWMLSSSRYVDADVVLRCVERSAGHPLLLEQLLQGREEGVDPDAPAPIAALVAARLATLDLDDRRAVELAAVCGARFDMAAVAAALGRTPWDAGAAVTAGLVTFERLECRFTHGLVRDAVYAGLTDADRRRLHRAVALVLDDPGQRAEHLEQAGDPDAPFAHLQAARREDDAGRSGLALAHVDRGLALSPTDAVRAALLSLAGRIHVDRGRPEAALVAFEQATMLARSPIDRCLALLGSVSALRLQSRHEQAEVPLADAEALAVEHGQDELIGLAAYYRGCLLFARGDVAGCTSEHERAIRHAQAAGQPRTEALALSGLGDAHYAQSRIRTALEVIGRCVRLAREHGYGRIEVGNLFMRGALRALQNDVSAGLHDCLEAARMAARVGNRRAEMLAALNAGICLTVQGETAAALGRIAHATRIAEEMDARVFRGISWAFEARARVLGGDREGGLSRARTALEQARDGGMRFYGGLALGVLARATHDDDERERALEEGELLLSEPCMSHNYFYFYDDAIEAWSATGRWDRVERCAAALDVVDAQEPIGRCRLLAARARALAGMALDPTSAAAIATAQAVLAAVRRAGLRPLEPALERALHRASHPGAPP